MMTQNSPSDNAMFTFVWRIENFSSTCSQISSPEFEAKMLDGTVWCLEFSPETSSSSLGHGYIICRSTAIGSEAINLCTLISCSSENGEFLPIQQIDDHDFSNTPTLHFSLVKLEPGGRSVFLPNDTLTIRCQLWQNGRESSQVVQCFALSRLGTTRIVRVWKVALGYFSNKQETIILHSGNADDPYLELSGFRAKSSGYFHIKIIANKKHSVRGKISVLDGDGKTEKLSQSIHWYLESTNANHYTNFIPKSFARLDTLYLLCDFMIFNGKNFNAIEEVKCTPLMYPNLRWSRLDICEAASLDDPPTWCRCFSDRGTQTFDVLEDLSSESDLTSEAVESSEQQLATLQEDMLDLYTKKKFCDLTLRAGGKTFPVHAAVLCARSQKFREMLLDSRTEEGDRWNEKETDAKMEEKNGANVLGAEETETVYHTFEKVAINPDILKSNKVNESEVWADAKCNTRVEKNALERSGFGKIKHHLSEMQEKKRDFRFSENVFTCTENAKLGFDYGKSENEYVVETKETLKPFAGRENKSSLERTIQKENIDCLDILDMDSDTLCLLLTFMYSDAVGDIQADRASHLYFASTKYAVFPLQAKCLSIVESTLSVSNVCKVLMLSDDFEGDEIRKMAEDFFCGHTKDILLLDAWKTIMKNRPQLASQLMFKAFLQKT